jgi:precorrin-3B C17-methyltransferase
MAAACPYLFLLRINLDSHLTLPYAYARNRHMSGKIYLIGIGPGQPENITPRALAAMAKVSVVIVQPECLDLVEEIISGKEVVSQQQSPLDRSRVALEKSQVGHDVAIVSNGDPGVYAIASTFFGYLKDNHIQSDVEVIPGLSLAAYAAAQLGAPLGNDTATITLCDQGTPWPQIRKRLKSAAIADFVIAIYNPFGKLGPARLREAIDIISESRPPDTPRGVLSQVATANEKAQITTVGELASIPLPVDTLIIIGNSQSFIHEGKMVTPRSYRQGVGY